MDNRTRLVLGIIQVENLTELFKDNEYKDYIYNHLNPIYYELQRQLSHEQHGQETGRHGHGRTDVVSGGSREASI